MRGPNTLDDVIRGRLDIVLVADAIVWQQTIALRASSRIRFELLRGTIRV